MLVRVSWRSTGIPSAMLAIRRSIRCSPREQARWPAVRAEIAAGQPVMAIRQPSTNPGPVDEPAAEGYELTCEVVPVQPGPVGDKEFGGGFEAQYR
jgi:hypothetical protein